MDNKIELAIKCVYEMYKVDWMRRITPEQIINEAKCWFDSWIDCLEEAQTFSEWVEENGFGGELYVCFDEFCECELNDKDYIRNLIGDNDEMMEIIEQYWGAKMEIIVKDYSSNIEMFIYDNDENYVFNVYHDDCMYHPYDINLEAIIENISETLERKLTQEEEFSAIDICVIDLTNATLDLIKVGSAVSVLKYDMQVKNFVASSLPLGILEEIKPTIFNLSLSTGNMLILATDGVADSFSSVEEYSNFVNNIMAVNPQIVAENILNKAIENNNQVPKDDMTVLDIKIFEI